MEPEKNIWKEFQEHLEARARNAMENNLPIQQIAEIITWSEYVGSHIDMGGLFEISPNSTTF